MDWQSRSDTPWQLRSPDCNLLGFFNRVFKEPYIWRRTNAFPWNAFIMDFWCHIASPPGVWVRVHWSMRRKMDWSLYREESFLAFDLTSMVTLDSNIWSFNFSLLFRETFWCLWLKFMGQNRLWHTALSVCILITLISSIRIRIPPV